MTEQDPTYSYLRLGDRLRLMGVGMSAAAVRYVWQRGLATRFAWLLWLERRSAEGGVVLTEHLKQLLQRDQAARRARAMEAEQKEKELQTQLDRIRRTPLYRLLYAEVKDLEGAFRLFRRGS